MIRRKEYIELLNDEYEKIEYAAWRHGQYVISAVQKALDPKKAKYPDRPFGKNEETQQHPEIQARKFEDWANAFNKKFEQEYQDSV